jgi:hypothetical protein
MKNGLRKTLRKGKTIEHRNQTLAIEEKIRNENDVDTRALSSLGRKYAD